VQLILESPMQCCRGDHFLIRDYGETEILGGGEILDPLGVRAGRTDLLRIGWERSGDGRPAVQGGERAALCGGGLGEGAERDDDPQLPATAGGCRSGPAPGEERAAAGAVAGFGEPDGGIAALGVKCVGVVCPPGAKSTRRGQNGTFFSPFGEGFGTEKPPKNTKGGSLPQNASESEVP